MRKSDDIIGEEISRHFKTAFIGLKQYEKEIHLRMLEAMKGNQQPADVRSRLVLTKNVPIQKIGELITSNLNRYERQAAVRQMLLIP